MDRAGAEYWLYPLHGRSPWRQPILELPSQTQPERAEPIILDGAYRALLGALALSACHRQALRQRGLPDVEILRRGYRTLPLEGRAALARRVVERFGADTCAAVPGFYVDAQGTRHWWTLAGAPGLLIPVRTIAGRIAGIKVRRDDPGEGSRYTYLSSSNHGGLGPGAPVHVPLHPFAPGAPVRVTEGELKADIATVLSNTLTLSIPGVSMWRKALPILQALQATRVLLAFDSDWRTNPHVACALGQAAFALVKAGYAVQVEDWEPALGKGIDDLLAAGHSPRLRCAAMAFGALVRGRARPSMGQLRTISSEEVRVWHA